MGCRALLACALLAAALLAGDPGALAGRHAEPGVTATELLLGATVPLTGPASADAAAARGADAYFRWVNARGGVHGRKIVYRYVDDASDPAQTLEVTRRLVEEDGVLALFNSYGTEQSLAVRDYATGLGVPQLFVDSGASTFGRDYRRYQSTIGFRPSYAAEGRIYGLYLARTRPRARVAVLVGDDADGRELVAGLSRGLAGSGAKVVATQPAALDVTPQIGELNASRADVLAVFAPPSVARQAFAAARRLAWRPLTLVSSNAGTAALRPPEGAVSLTYLKDPSDKRWAEDAGMRLFRSILSRYAKGANARDGRHVYGMAVAHTLVRVLRAAGPAPTRAGVLARTRLLRDPSNPFLLPGITVRTSATDRFPIEQAQLRRWSNGSWRPFGGLWAS